MRRLCRAAINNCFRPRRTPRDVVSTIADVWQAEIEDEMIAGAGSIEPPIILIVVLPNGIVRRTKKITHDGVAITETLQIHTDGIQIGPGACAMKPVAEKGIVRSAAEISV